MAENILFVFEITISNFKYQFLMSVGKITLIYIVLSIFPFDLKYNPVREL